MRIFVILLLLVPVILLKARNQDPADGPPDVQVGEISSSKFSTYDYNAPISRRTNSNTADTRSRRLIYEDEIRNRNSIENRSRDMLDLEESVLRESRNAKPLDLFRYRVNLKNTGLKVVKSIFWDYQASYTDDFADASHRQFRCTAKLKPNQSERFEGYSMLPPIRVVSAANKTYNQRVVINRVDYADGTYWQRPEWHEPPPGNMVSRGNCHPL
jgi:hypothetical protein